MCGITAILNPDAASREPLAASAQTMADTMRHRGPDDSGVWVADNAPLALGHRRLSIIDLSENGHQPMHSASGRYVISYNGEIYNCRQIEEALGSAGQTFTGRSDTEILLAAIDNYGLNAALQKLEGMFAMIIYDRRDRQIHLIRDRLGKKPLYIARADDGAVLMASELKAFMAYPGFARSVDRNVLGQYMRYGYVPAPFCIFSGAAQLLPGTRLSLDCDTLADTHDFVPHMKPYWDISRLTAEQQSKGYAGNAAQAEDDFARLLDECTHKRMISDVPLGAFLSGGLDSSAIVASMQAKSGRPVKTFTIGFDEPGFNEAEFARAIAEHLGTEHYEKVVTAEDAQALVPEMPRIYDEPFADASQIPTTMISRFARQHVSVALSGDGGDEMLGGYNRHNVLPGLMTWLNYLPMPARQMLAGLIMRIPPTGWDRLRPGQDGFGARLHKLAAVMDCRDLDAMYHRLTAIWPSPETIVAGCSQLIPPVDDPALQPEGLSPAEQLMYKDAISYLPGDILTKVDRASMAVSLEARAPLLDHAMYEFVWSLPPQVRMGKGESKWLLRSYLRRHMPESLFARPKHGFTPPIDNWLRGPLREWAGDLLNNERLQREGFFIPEAINDRWKAHQNGDRDHGSALWTAAMFQAWLDEWGISS